MTVKTIGEFNDSLTLQQSTDLAHFVRTNQLDIFGLMGPATKAGMADKHGRPTNDALLSYILQGAQEMLEMWASAQYFSQEDAIEFMTEIQDRIRKAPVTPG